MLIHPICPVAFRLSSASAAGLGLTVSLTAGWLARFTTNVDLVNPCLKAYSSRSQVHYRYSHEYSLFLSLCLRATVEVML